MKVDNVIVDMGNYDIKYRGNVTGKFSSKISTDFNPNAEAFERIEINGVTTYIGVGMLQREYNKADKNYLAQVLYATTKATTNREINLGLLLPVVQLTNKNKFIDTFKGKTFNFKINGKDKSIHVNKVAVLPEGYIAYYSSNYSTDCLTVDVGSRTLNFATFVDGQVEMNWTEKLGTFDFYTIIKDLENSKGETYTEEDIERQIKRGRIKVDEVLYVDFLKKILNFAKAKVSLKNYDTIFCGGGAELLRPYITKYTPADVLENAQYTNVNGAYNVCKKMWG